MTVSARRYFRGAMFKASFSKADARDLSTGEPTPEAPRTILDVLGTLDKLPFHIQARSEFEYVGAKPLGDGFTGRVKEFRLALLRPFADGRMSLGMNLFIGSGYTGQTTETFALPDETAPFGESLELGCPHTSASRTPIIFALDRRTSEIRERQRQPGRPTVTGNWQQRVHGALTLKPNTTALLQQCALPSRYSHLQLLAYLGECSGEVRRFQTLHDNSQSRRNLPIVLRADRQVNGFKFGGVRSLRRFVNEFPQIARRAKCASLAANARFCISVFTSSDSLIIDRAGWRAYNCDESTESRFLRK
jgi:hypothetical protein